MTNTRRMKWAAVVNGIVVGTCLVGLVVGVYLRSGREANAAMMDPCQTIIDAIADIEDDIADLEDQKAILEGELIECQMGGM